MSENELETASMLAILSAGLKQYHEAAEQIDTIDFILCESALVGKGDIQKEMLPRLHGIVRETFAEAIFKTMHAVHGAEAALEQAEAL